MMATVALCQVLNERANFPVSPLIIVRSFISQITKVVAEQHKCILKVKAHVLLSLIRVGVIPRGRFAYGPAFLDAVNAIRAPCILWLLIVVPTLQFAGHAGNVD